MSESKHPPKTYFENLLEKIKLEKENKTGIESKAKFYFKKMLAQIKKEKKEEKTAKLKKFFSSLLSTVSTPTLKEEVKSLMKTALKLHTEQRVRQVLTQEEKNQRKKAAIIKRLREGTAMTIRESDFENYDEKHECEIKESRMLTAYANYLSSYAYKPSTPEPETNVTNYMECVREMATPRIESFLRTNGTMKFFYAYSITFEGIDGRPTTGQFYSNSEVIYNQHDIANVIGRAEDKIWDDIDHYNIGGSGRIILGINVAYVNMGIYNPIAGAGTSYFEVKKYKGSKCVLNIKNDDMECFRWCILAKLHPAATNKDRVSNYSQYYNDIVFPEKYDKKVGFPPYGPMMNKFEEINDISVSVYGVNKKDKIYPIRPSRKESDLLRTVHLLYIEDEEKDNRHYLLISNFDAFLNKNKKRMYHCKYCLTGFTTQDLRDKHLSGDPCFTLNEQSCRIELPKKGSTIEYKNTWKEKRFPVVIYADSESDLTTPIDTQIIISTLDSACDGLGSNTAIRDMICEYADLDHCTIKTGESTTKYQYHKMRSFAYHVVFSGELKNTLRPRSVIYRGDGAARKMLEMLKKDCSFYNSKIKWTKTTSDEPDDEGKFVVKKTRNKAYEHFKAKDIKIPIFMHNSVGYDSHMILLELAKVCKRASCIPRTGEKFVSFEADGMIFKDSLSFLSAPLDELTQNLVCKASPSLVQAAINDAKSQEILADFETKNFRQTRNYYREEKHTKNFYNNSGNPENDMKNPYCYSYSRIRLLTQKVPYPYSYMTCAEKYNEKEMPDASAFISDLDRTEIDGKVYESCSIEEAKEKRELAVKVYNEFKLKTLGEFSDIYLRSDVLNLADVFETFRDTCLRVYGLDPVNYYTLPGYSWDCCLKMTKAKLELFTEGQLDMLLFAEKGIRGGISMISNRYGKAYNKYTRRKMEEEKKYAKIGREYIGDKYILYYDANALYSSAMTSYLPYGKYKWCKEDNYDSILGKIKSGQVGATSDKGYMLEVDLNYPQSLHDLHNDYPCAPEPTIIENKMLSEHSIKMKYDVARLLKDRREGKITKETTNYKGIKIHESKTPKLVCKLTNREKYVIHYTTLKKYIDLGLEVTKIHRILSFEQKPWMKPFIDGNIALRKEAKNDFEKSLYKLMNNAVFGKTMENVRKRKEVDLIIGEKKLEKKLNSMKSGTWTEIKGGLIIMNKHKEKMIMNKPIIIGASIMDISKTTMYDFHYNTIKKKYGDNAKLLFTDTDSLCYEITTGDVYRDIYEDKDFLKMLDTSCYSDIKDEKDYRSLIFNDPVYGGKNTKGCMKLFKDDIASKGYNMIKEFVGLRAKMYSLEMLENDKNGQPIEKSTAKGVKTKAKKHLRHQKYKDCLFGTSIMDRCQMIKFNIIRSHKHELFSEQISKISLSAADDKFYQVSNTGKYAYGHYLIDLIENI